MSLPGGPSERARELVRRLGCMPPGWSRAELTALLREHGAPELDVHLAFEEHLASLRLDEYRTTADGVPTCHHEQRFGLLQIGENRFGTLSAHRHYNDVPVRRDFQGTTVVLLGLAAVGGAYYVAASGEVLHLFSRHQGFIATSPWVLIEKLARIAGAERAPFQATISAAEGARLSSALSLASAAAATDRYGAFWEDDEVTMQEGDLLPPGPRTTRVYLASLARLAGIVRACARENIALAVAAQKPESRVEPVTDAPPFAPPEGAAVYGNRRPREHGAVWVKACTTGEVVEQMVLVHDGPVAEWTTFAETTTVERRYGRAEDTLVGLLSPEALSELRRRGAVRDPRDRASRQELEVLLETVGLVGFDAAFEVEEKFGGLKLESGRYQLGIYAVIRDAIECGGSGTHWYGGLPGALPLAASRDGTTYLAPDGSVHLLCYELDRFDRLADSVEIMLERSLYRQPEYRFAHSVTVEALMGAPLAASLGLTKVELISDSVETSWIGPGLEVHESRCGEQPSTNIHGDAPARVAAALVRALDLAPGATYWPDLDVQEALDELLAMDPHTPSCS